MLSQQTTLFINTRKRQCYWHIVLCISATAWEDGTLNTLTDTADVINFRKLNPGIQQFIVDHNNAKAQGFDSIFDMYDHATETYNTAEKESQVKSFCIFECMCFWNN